MVDNVLIHNPTLLVSCWSQPVGYCVCTLMTTTIEVESFAGLNICNFNPTKVFTEMLSHYLGHKFLLFSIINGRHLYSWETFCSTLENCEICERLAQQIFSQGVYKQWIGLLEWWNSGLKFLLSLSLFCHV